MSGFFLVYRSIELSLDLSSNACYDLYAYIEAHVVIQDQLSGRRTDVKLF